MKKQDTLGHILRMPREYHCATALTWTPMGKRKVGHPKTTWHRTKRGQWQAGSPRRKREPWLWIGTNGRGVMWPYEQQRAEKIGKGEGQNWKSCRLCQLSVLVCCELIVMISANVTGYI